MMSRFHPRAVRTAASRNPLRNSHPSLASSSSLGCPPWNSAAPAALPPAAWHRHVQVASHWQAVIRRNRTDPKTGQPKFQDWDDVIDGFHRPTLMTTGQSLLDRHLRAERHIKPKEVRRQINSAKIYKRSVKRVDDLVSYIQFMHKKDKEDGGDDF